MPVVRITENTIQPQNSFQVLEVLITTCEHSISVVSKAIL